MGVGGFFIGNAGGEGIQGAGVTFLFSLFSLCRLGSLFGPFGLFGLHLIDGLPLIFLVVILGQRVADKGAGGNHQHAESEGQHDQLAFTRHHERHLEPDPPAR